MSRASRLYVRAGAAPDSPPPPSERGLVRWLRSNLFYSAWSSTVTVVLVICGVLVLSRLLDWAIFGATWTGATRGACLDAQHRLARGACWIFVKVRIGTLLYGFYPAGEIWRIWLLAGLAGGALGLPAMMAPRAARRLARCVGLILLFPIGGLLLRGGLLGLPPVETSKWGGLFLTLLIAGTGTAISLPLGVLLALGRRSTLPVLRGLAIAFIELVRGVPLVTVLFMASVMLPLFLPSGFEIDKLLRALIGVSLFAAAYMAEVVRGGLQAIPKGQYEAAMALGFGYWRRMGLVILPQALRIALPGIINTYIGLLKDTTLVAVIGLIDLIGMVSAATADPAWLGFATEGYVFVGLLFWIFCYAMSRYGRHLEATFQGERR